MPQDAYTLRYIADGLNKMLAGGKISKINMPEKDELSLIIYTHSGSVKLEICTSAKKLQNKYWFVGKTQPRRCTQLLHAA